MKDKSIQNECFLNEIILKVTIVGIGWISLEVEPFLKYFELFGDSFAFGSGHDEF